MKKILMVLFVMLSFFSAQSQNDCQAAFSFQRDSAGVYSFFDQSNTGSDTIGIVNSWTWSFTTSNGYSTSSLQNPVLNLGNYSGGIGVRLRIYTSTGCQSYISDSIINGNLCNLNITGVVTDVALGTTNTGAIDLTVIGNYGNVTYNWNTGDSIQDLSQLAGGSYFVFVTDSIGCETWATYSVGIIQQQCNVYVGYNVNGTVVNCTDQTGIVDTSIHVVSWYWEYGPYGASPTQTSTLQNPVFNTNNYTGSVELSLTIQTSTGCSSQGGAVFNVTGTPCVISFTTNVTPATTSTLGMFTVNATGGTPPYNYNPIYPSWISYQFDSVFIGQGCVDIQVTDNNGCSSNIQSVCIPNDSTVSLCHAEFSTQLDSAVSVTCTDLSYTSNSVPVVAWNWTLYRYNMPPVFSNLQNPVFNINNYHGQMLISLEILTADSCSSIHYDSIYYNDPCNLTFTTSIVPATLNNQGSITVQATGGTLPYIYWFDHQAYTYPIFPGYTGCYSVEVTDANGCSDSLPSVCIPLDSLAYPCQSSFTYQIDSGIVHFFDQSQADSDSGSYIVQWQWSFHTNSGNFTDSIPNPSFPFSPSDGGLAVSLSITTSNGCTSYFYDTINLTILCNIAISANITPVAAGTVNTGAITVNATGGVGSYTYSWSNGDSTSTITNLAVGNYTVTVIDSLNCTAMGTYYVLQDDCGAAYIVAGPDLQNNYYYSEVAAIPNTTISWTWTGDDGYISTVQNPGPINLNNYVNSWFHMCLTIQNSFGCTSTYCDSVFVDSLPTVNCTLAATYSVTPISVIGGNDGAIEVTTSGGIAPLNFIWNTGATTQDLTGLSSGNYSITITDSVVSCPAVVLNISLFEPYDQNGGPIVDTLVTNIIDTCFSSPVDSFYISQIVVNNDNTVTVTWEFVCNSQTYLVDATYDFSAIGNQAIILTLNCNSKTLVTYMSYIHINTINDVKELQTKNEIVVYPVPARDFVNIEMNLDKQSTIEINVINLEGQSIYRNHTNGISGKNIWKVDVQNLAAGFYFLEIYSNGSKTAVKKIMK